MIRVRAVVSGLVQGVGFRYSAQEQAARLGVAGWVRNLPDDTVECEVEGPAEAVGTMVDWLRHGPRHARVGGVHVQDVPVTGAEGFRIT
ncbi:acylphosphatase [Miniimonas arenae]|uniref:acylphosphatase n=1 Tax=Miniimonas arenae TaxID=676201 RepID=A0A5C5BCU0_9MICO|nr:MULTISPECIES: acylphosphatase [Miniimonas]TNU75105.1 acylphosphatase [Miniimonas arenae]